MRTEDADKNQATDENRKWISLLKHRKNCEGRGENYGRYEECQGRVEFQEFIRRK